MTPAEIAEHRRVWKAIPTSLRWLLLAQGLVKFDTATGTPVLVIPDVRIEFHQPEPVEREPSMNCDACGTAIATLRDDEGDWCAECHAEYQRVRADLEASVRAIDGEAAANVNGGGQ